MKILLSAFACNPRWGSEFSTGWNWAYELAKAGHEVTVLTSLEFRDDIFSADPKDIDFRFIELGGPEANRQAHSAMRDAASLMFYRCVPGVGIYDAYQRWQYKAFRVIAAESERYDVVHHVTWGGLHLGSHLWRMPTPFVYGPIGGGQTAPAAYRRYFGRSWAGEVARSMSTGGLLRLNGQCRQTLRHSTVTLVCNSATASIAERLGARDVRFMLADGVPSSWMGNAHMQPTGDPVILFVGRLIPRKAPTLAVEAFAELRKRMRARMLIAGDGPLRDDVLATAERLGVRDDVELTGLLPHEKVQSWYDSATVLLFSSLRESFGAPMLEASARGLPAVALNLHGIADAEFGEAAIKVALPDSLGDLPRRLAAALETVICDGHWQTRSSAAITFASRWLWPRKIEAAEEIYRQVAA